MQPAQQRSRPLAPGDKLGKYELIRQIAIGGMAELYLARTVGIEGFEKLVVVKRILPQYASNASFVAMFLNEARLAATLHHPNVAQVYDIGVEDGDYFFAMEYVHGEDLDQMSSQSHDQGVPISMDAALTLVAGLCAGLHYAHERMGPDGAPLEIVHRDVSPSNVLVSYDGAVKLVDFGIARATSRTTSGHGGLKGKISYMSPEQCRADIVLDRRSDIYSIGTLLYELTTGRAPFIGETEYAILNQIVNVDVPPPSRFVPDYPVALERIVLRALARDPAQRHASALVLQGEVEDFAHENRLRVSPLVLARLMGTLFPARLEEWDNAKSQGAFFVEQHVVRTLIESGKTPDPNDPAAQAQIKAAQDDYAASDPTTITAPPSGSAPPPIVTAAPPMPFLRTPVPGGFAVPAGGRLVSSSNAGAGVVARAATVEVTERVFIGAPSPAITDAPVSPMRPTMPTRHGRKWLGVAALVLAGGAAAAVIAFRGMPGDDKAATLDVATPPPSSEPAKQPTPAPPVPPPPPTPTEPPIANDVAAAATANASTGSASAATDGIAAQPMPKKVVVRAPPKPHVAKPKPAPKEEPWNADSPFMPVRSH